jgi:hypothetical protein
MASVPEREAEKPAAWRLLALLKATRSLTRTGSPVTDWLSGSKTCAYSVPARWKSR